MLRRTVQRTIDQNTAGYEAHDCYSDFFVMDLFRNLNDKNSLIIVNHQLLIYDVHHAL